MTTSFPLLRLRRLRTTSAVRELVREVRLHPSDLVYPIFIDDNLRKPKAIESMPGQLRLPVESVADEAKTILESGVGAMLLFGIPRAKDEMGSQAYASDGVVQKSTQLLRREFGSELVIIGDVCLCEYTSHGHCGVIDGGELENDATLKLLEKTAVSQAEAGVDLIAPSGMIDGQVKAIRRALDDAGFRKVGIMSYSAKHASCFYGPFREAAGSTPQFGDRKGYQMDYSNPREAMREMELDVKEGADIVMVKPALAYLDIIYRAKRRFDLPIAAYNVSGEYSMVKAASMRGWIDEMSATLEILVGIKRAGADLIVTYFAKDVARWLA